MRVVHVNTQDMEGGAARIAWTLATLQRAAGHEAVLLVGRKKRPGKGSVRFDARPDPVSGPLFIEELRQSFYLLGSHDLAAHPLVRSADVLHLHNLQFGYFNPLTLSALSQLKPTVWTLHDMHPFTGLCLHAYGCEGWRSDCRGCLRTVIDRDNLDPSLTSPQKQEGVADNLRVKRIIYGHSRLVLTAPSEWMASRARGSVLAGHPLLVIPNGIDASLFSPGGKARARQRLGIPQDVPAMGASAIGGVFQNPIKGGESILEAVRLARERLPEAVFVNIGAYGPSPGPGIVNIPYLTSPQDVADAYRALDLFLFASKGESFSLTTAEAMACGLPVVSFATGPLPELVEDGEHGLLVAPGDAAALADAAVRLLTDPDRRARMGARARERAAARFGEDVMARRFEDAYALAAERFARRGPPSFLPLGQLPQPMATPELAALESAKDQRPGEAPGLALKRYMDRLSPGDAKIVAMTPRERLISYLTAGLDGPCGAFRQAQLAKQTALAGAEAFEERGSHGEAARAYGELYASYPGDRGLLKRKAVALWMDGKERDSLACFLQYHADTPPRLDAWLTLSELLQRDGRLDEAMAALDKVRDGDPFHVGLARRMADIHAARGEWRKAARAYMTEYRTHGGADLPDRAARMLEAAGKPLLAGLLRRRGTRTINAASPHNDQGSPS